MSSYQWAMIILTGLGFAVTIGVILVGVTRAVEAIKLDTSKKIADEVLARTTALANEARARDEAIDVIRREFEQSQRSHDHSFGEVNAAMREKIATVEKKVYEVELWGRDNFAGKEDVRDILKDLKEMRTEIKADFRDLNAKIDSKTT